MTPLVRENVKVALKSIKSNKLRSVLTILMIAIGITSLLGILTATEVPRQALRVPRTDLKTRDRMSSN